MDDMDTGVCPHCGDEVQRLRAIIAGSPDAPTDAELDAHAGPWLARLYNGAGAGWPCGRDRAPRAPPGARRGRHAGRERVPGGAAVGAPAPRGRDVTYSDTRQTNG